MNEYQRIAGEIESQVQAGELLAGMRLPSVRELASARGISPTTVVEIYELLKTRGIVEARQRSGYFVAPPAQPQLSLPERPLALIPSSSLAAEDLLQDMLAANNDDRIFPFGAAIPRPAFYPGTAVARTMRQVLRDDPALLTAYRFTPGSEALRHALARRYLRFGVKTTAKAIVTTLGAVEAIGIALGAVAEPGSTIALEAPTYPGIFKLVRSLGYRVLEIPLDPARGLTPAALQAAIRKARGALKAVVTVPNFSNPLGTRVSDEDKLELVKLASRHGLVLIEDDIYADLSFTKDRPRPLKAFDTDDSVILCTSFSKTVSPTLRVGAVINGRHAAKFAALKYARGTGISALNEEVLRHYLEHGQHERHLNKVRADYRTLVAQYSQAILRQFPAGTRLSQPAGGFILWVELPHEIEGAQVQKRALKQRISVAPGSIFSDCGCHYRNFIRLNCAIPWTEASQKALSQIARLIG